VSAGSELLSIVPVALDLVQALREGDQRKAELKAKAVTQALALKATTRAAAKATKKALGK
jgi:hypothetical protein